MTRHEGRPLVVVVEDDETIRELLTDELELLGHSVRSAGSALEGVELIAGLCSRGTRPSLLLLDWELPDGTGDDVLGLLDRGGLDGYPVVLMTGHLLRAASRRPVTQILQKPFDLATLVETVQLNVAQHTVVQHVVPHNIVQPNVGQPNVAISQATPERAASDRGATSWVSRLTIAVAASELVVG